MRCSTSRLGTLLLVWNSLDLGVQTPKAPSIGLAGPPEPVFGIDDLLRLQTVLLERMVEYDAADTAFELIQAQCRSESERQHLFDELFAFLTEAGQEEKAVQLANRAFPHQPVLRFNARLKIFKRRMVNQSLVALRELLGKMGANQTLSPLTIADAARKLWLVSQDEMDLAEARRLAAAASDAFDCARAHASLGLLTGCCQDFARAFGELAALPLAEEERVHREVGTLLEHIAVAIRRTPSTSLYEEEPPLSALVGRQIILELEVINGYWAEMLRRKLVEAHSF